MGILGLVVRGLFPPPSPPQTKKKPLTVSVKRLGRFGKPIVEIDRTVPLWRDWGWSMNSKGDVLNGYYKSNRGRFKGKILKWRSKYPEFYIFSPPESLLNDPNHGSCFIEKADGVFFVHWNKKPRTVDQGILRITSILNGSL